MSGPQIVIVPGFWLGPRPYDLLVSQIRTLAPSLPPPVFAELSSTGKRSPGAPTMLDDAAGIAAVLSPIVKSGKRVVLVAHSSGALLAAMATEGLLIPDTHAGQGGVERIVFIAGGILQKGQRHPPTAWEAKDGETWVADPDDKLFNDVDPAVVAKHATPYIKCQPLMEEWNAECTYVPFDGIPSTYILTEQDRTISPQVQEMCAGIAKAEVVRVPFGHMVMLSQPKMLAEKILAAVGGAK